MNDLNRNTRTLVICFVVAIFTLIPLRFYEAGSEMAMERSEVLGVQRQVEIELPNDKLRNESVSVLEFPYEEIESAEVEDCVTEEEADRVVENLTDILKTPGLDSELVTAAMEEIKRVEASVCK